MTEHRKVATQQSAKSLASVFSSAEKQGKAAQRVGIFSGTFDPIHAGHIDFGLRAMQLAKLDKVYYLPEAQPRRKEGITHYAHRIAMIKFALKPHPNLELLELPDKQFSVSKTLPRLKKRFPDSQLFMLIGSDMSDMLISPRAQEQWPGIDELVRNVTFIVSVRGRRLREEDRQKVDRLQSNALIFASGKPNLSSRDIRESLMRGKQHRDVLPSIKDYIRANWLYSSPAAAEPANNS